MSRRDEAREILRELLHEALAGGNGNGRHAAGDHAPAPAAGTPPVPAPPVAAVFRPSSWDRPPAPGEVIGDRPPATQEAPPSRPPSPKPQFAPPPRGESARGRREDAPGRGEGAPGRGAGARGRGEGAPARGAGAAPDRGVEWVTLDTDADLARFVRDLLARAENPRDRVAMRTGRLRFALRRAAQATPGAPTTELRIECGAVTERTIKEAAAAGARVVLAPAAVITPLAKEKARALGVEIEREKPC